MKPDVTNSARRPSETLLHPKTKVGGDLSALGVMEAKWQGSEEGNYTCKKENKKPNTAKEWKKRRERKTLTKRRK
jgi:hypothetical protein